MQAERTTDTYARLVLAGNDGKRTTRYVRVVKDGAMCVGERVTRDGERWERETTQATQVEVIMWTPDDVVTRTDLVMDYHYGTLVEA